MRAKASPSKASRPPAAGSDDSAEVYRPRLAAMFSPRSVALIGATEREGSVGRSLLQNLVSKDFGGDFFPVNPKHARVLGRKCYASIEAVPVAVDLAVITTPAATVPDIVEQCARAGVKGAIIVSAGFREIGSKGAELEQEIRARRGAMRLLGPNCLGAMLPHWGLNATFAADMARPGSVAFLSQSGALCTSVLDWSLRENVGFSAFVSMGSMVDLNWGDLIDYLGNDPHTRSIVIYMEAIGDARAFLSAAREVALTKPIIVIKVGRSAAAAQAAVSHTGSMVGDDEVFEAAFRRVGVLRVETIAELFAMAETLGKQPRPAGPRLAIVTNAGGPGGLATDALIAGGAQIAELSPESKAALEAILPAHWSHNNPVDILGDACAERYAQAVEIVSRDANTDGSLVILTPQAMTDATGTAAKIAALAPTHGKPLLTSWMGGPAVESGKSLLNEAGIPTFRHPDTAARIFAHMWRYQYHLRSIYETPVLTPESKETAAQRHQATRLLRSARKAGRTLLNERESMQILAAYGIPTVPGAHACNAAEAVKAAETFGYPVVLKLCSAVVVHKTDAGGVKLNLPNAAAVRTAYAQIEKTARALGGGAFQGVTVEPMMSSAGYELILGSTIDPQFGPVMLFGAGGILVETLRDRALALPPLTTTLARRMMERTRIYEALRGVRGRKPVDLALLEQLLVRFSQMVAEQRAIREIDINPLLVSAERIVAVDARMVLHPPAIAEADLPRTAIQPYPTQYISNFRLRSGRRVVLRPIRPEDEQRMIAFHRTLSDFSVHYRYFGQLSLDQRISHDRLARICFNDYDREIALVAEQTPRGASESVIVGVGRLSKLHGLQDVAEFAIIVSDEWQGEGLGTRLLSELIKVGRQEKLSRMIGHILPGNAGMLHLCRHLGFTVRRDDAAEEMVAELRL